MNLPAVVLLSLCLCSVSAVAQDACRLRLSPGTVDFGAATRNDLLVRSATDASGPGFGVRTVHLWIQCPGPRVIRWAFVAPDADGRHFRWGAGILRMRVLAARLDGVPVQLRRDGDQPLDAGGLRPGDRVVAWREGTVVPGERLEVELAIDARTDDTSSRVRDLTRYEGHGTFQLQ